MFLNRNKTYSISIEDDGLVTPEEILLDSTSQYSDIEKPIPGSIFRIFLIIFSIASFVLAGFTLKISILDHDAYAQIALKNKSANFPLPAPRGMIVDRNNQPLVKNVPVFNLLAITRELKEDQEKFDQQIIKIAEILKVDPQQFRELVINEMKLSSTFFAHQNLEKDQVLAIEYLSPNGFYLAPDTKREYMSGNKFSHILGYTGKVNKEDLNDPYYFPTDTIGRLGIESTYENLLRGVHGNIFFSREESDLVTRQPKAGNTLTLNIDHDLQVKLYDEIFITLRESGLSRAVGIVQNPRTGEVLAMVSFPNYDNNIFSDKVSQEDYKKLFESPAKPLFNRAISGQYNPGSTIKPLVGMAALEEKIVSYSDTINDCVSITIPNPYDNTVAYTFKNWRVEFGPFNMKKAIANSCNIYFFTVAGGFGDIKGLGAEKIINYLKASKADSELGIDLPGETRGFIPTPEWKLRERGENWYLGDTYNISIGQGDLLVTPLWLNSYVSAIANGGSIYKPNIAQKISGDKENLITDIKPEVIGQLPFSEQTINQIKNAMRETVVSGTAQIFNELPVKAAAKTGTAEVIKGKSINSLLTIFLPYDNPELAMTILIEGSASNQGLAIRAAYNTLKWHLERGQ